MITLTPAAAAAIDELLVEEALEGFGLRVHVVGGGCEGFAYDLAVAPGPSEDEATFESRGVALFVDRRALPLLEGLVIDHRDTFRFENPNAARTCRCGASFSG